MNQEIGEKWVEALRSGEYEQGRIKLYMDGAHCCLGVLCVVMERYEELKPGRGYPSESVLGEAEINRKAVTHLYRMNDSFGKSFSEIADHIEQNYMVQKEKEVVREEANDPERCADSSLCDTLHKHS